MLFPIYILIGILLGPTVFGFSNPLGAFTKMAAAGYLLVAGLECSFDEVRRDFRRLIIITIGTFIVPFAIGYAIAPFLGLENFTHRWFLGTALSVSALPVIIQILRESRLINQPIGQMIISIASSCDLITLVCFMVILPREQQLSWVEHHFTVFLFFISAAVAALIKIPEKFFAVANQATRWVFAPIFFISLGFQLDLLSSLNPSSIVIVTLVAVVGKVVGTYPAALIAGYSKLDSTRVSVALNARGAIEVLLCQIAYQNGIISAEWLTTFIFMALLTSIVASPCLKWLEIRMRKVGSAKSSIQPHV